MEERDEELEERDLLDRELRLLLPLLDDRLLDELRGRHTCQSGNEARGGQRTSCWRK